jgi:hypothetical protein
VTCENALYTVGSETHRLADQAGIPRVCLLTAPWLCPVGQFQPPLGPGSLDQQQPSPLRVSMGLAGYQGACLVQFPGADGVHQPGLCTREPIPGQPNVQSEPDGDLDQGMSSRVAPISWASVRSITPAATARASTRSGWSQGCAGALDQALPTRITSMPSACARARRPARGQQVGDQFRLPVPQGEVYEASAATNSAPTIDAQRVDLTAASPRVGVGHHGPRLGARRCPGCRGVSRSWCRAVPPLRYVSAL